MKIDSPAAAAAAAAVSAASAAFAVNLIEGTEVQIANPGPEHPRDLVCSIADFLAAILKVNRFVQILCLDKKMKRSRVSSQHLQYLGLLSRKM